MILVPSKFRMRRSNGRCATGDPHRKETGSLKDTVPYNKFTGEGVGFTFANYDTFDLLRAISGPF